MSFYKKVPVKRYVHACLYVDTTCRHFHGTQKCLPIKKCHVKCMLVLKTPLSHIQYYLQREPQTSKGGGEGLVPGAVQRWNKTNRERVTIFKRRQAPCRPEFRSTDSTKYLQKSINIFSIFIESIYFHFDVYSNRDCKYCVIPIKCYPLQVGQMATDHYACFQTWTCSAHVLRDFRPNNNDETEAGNFSCNMQHFRRSQKNKAT